MESPLHKLAPAGLKVIETLRFDPAEGFVRLGLHLDRTGRTCATLRFGFDRGACLMALGEAVGDAPARVRMTVDGAGEVAVTVAELAATPEVWKVAVAGERLRSDDPWLQVKTTERGVYDRARAALPDRVDEVIFLNERGEVCEGTITNVFVERDGVLLTPPASCGLLPGILRQELLAAGKAKEAVLRVEDLRGVDRVFVGNSLRGLIEAEFAA